MRVLCVSQNLPAETDPVALAFAAIPGNEVLSATQHKHAARHPGLARMLLRKCDPARFEKNYFGFMAQATKTAQDACSAFDAAVRGGFSPNIVLSCSSNGVGFALRQVFPEAFIVSMVDSKLCTLRPRGRELFEARRAVQQKQFCESDIAFIDFPCQACDLCGYGAEVFPPGVDTEIFCPAERPTDLPSLTIMAGALDIKALAGAWMFCRALLLHDPDIRISVLAENSLKDFSWNEKIKSLGDSSQRIRAIYWPSQDTWLETLRESGAVLCLSADLSICRRLLEAMICEKTVIVAENSLPFVKPGVNSLQLLERDAIKFVLDAARKPLPEVAMRAREMVFAGHDQAKIVPRMLDRIMSEYERRGRP